MTAIYNGLRFKTELEARWAAFFDLIGWKWHVNPVSVNNWQPDFSVTFECPHSECNGYHKLLAAVLPISKIEDFQFHPCLSYCYGIWDEEKDQYMSDADAGAAFGNGPTVTEWTISHGAGGGTEDIYMRIHNADDLWRRTANLVICGGD